MAFSDKAPHKTGASNKHTLDTLDTTLTTYFIRMLHIPDVTPFPMTECAKSYCKSCSFQSL